MREEDIVRSVIREAIHVHRTLGAGLLENVYKSCLAHRLTKCGFVVEIEKGISLTFEELHFEYGYRADLIIEGTVVIEVKAVEALAPVHTAQLLTYLQFLQLRFGLLLNFNVVLMKEGIHRVLRGF